MKNRKREYKIKQHKVAFFCIFLMTFLLCAGTVNTHAAERTVKVGYVEDSSLLTIDEKGKARGYAAEYLDEVAKYTGWKYEYISGTWEECLERVKNGTVDLLLPVIHTKERTQDFLFSKSVCCMSSTFLVGRKDDERYYYEDFQNFDGMTVGIIQDDYTEQVLNEFTEKHQFSVNKKEYPDGQSLEQALKQDEVDAVILGNITQSEDKKLLATIEYRSSYFITSKEQPDLIEELDRAKNKISLKNPYFNSNLHRKYYGNIEQQIIGYTRQEADLIAEGKELTVLCSRSNYPMSWYDEKSGTVQGIYADILDIISKESGLRFKLVPTSTKEEEADMIKGHKADLIMGVYASREKAEEYDISFTDPYYEMPYLILAKRGSNLLNEDEIDAAVVDYGTGLLQWMREEHGDWREIPCKDWKECIETLKDGKADISPINMLAWESMEMFHTETDLVNVATEISKIPVCIAVSNSQPDMLVSILNKTIMKTNTTEIDYCVLQNITSEQQKYSLRMLIHQYPIQTVILCIVVIFLILLTLSLLYVNRLRRRQNQILEEKNQQLEEAARKEKDLTRKAQIDKLTGLYDKITTEEKCARYLEENREGTLLCIDIDNFKSINDSFGHTQGDLILKKIGELITSCCRTDDIAGRIGGDEFLLFFKHMEDRDALRKRLEEFYERIETINEQNYSVRCTTGIAIAPEHGEDYKTLFAVADEAMYQAKKSGKNQYKIYDPEKKDDR